MAVERRGRGRTEHRPVAALRPRASGPAERFASRVGHRHPAAVFFGALLVGFVGLVAIAVLLGHLITNVLLEVGSIRRADEGAIDSMVAARTPVLTDVSRVVSEAGGALVLSLLAGLTAAVCAALRQWWIAAFALFVLPIETAAYRLTLNLVPRQRPSVERLDDLPAGGSFPSGHTAASIAVYAGLVLLLTATIPSRPLRLTAWGVAVVLPVAVATSRLYRGMHHPLDVVAGVLVGIGATAVVLFACRAGQAAARGRGSSRPPDPGTQLAQTTL
jgi:membrane-associated phospholipid phosphatase